MVGAGKINNGDCGSKIKVKKRLEKLIAAAVKKMGAEPLSFSLELPKQKNHGDLATNAAMLLARPLQKKPRDVAQMLVDAIETTPWIEKIEIAGPGFINFTLKETAYFEGLKEILRLEEKYGENDYGKGKKVLIEFVSANPTGPLNVVSCRAGVVGDTLACILEKIGFAVQREFYVNDAGNQTELFAKSLQARFCGDPVPEEGYHGEYMIALADDLKKKNYSLEEFRKIGLKKMIASQQSSLKKLGVLFDRWFLESELHQSKAIEKGLEALEKQNALYEKDGAFFFKSTDYGDDKDRVVRKQDGNYAYFAADIAYHHDKFGRTDRVINLLGPDHHGYVARLQAAVEALGHSKENFQILIVQQVNLMAGEETVKMSKRAGNLVTMDALVEEVGKDVARYFFLQRSATAHLDFDLALAKKETPENPVFYIQYAHARIFGIFRKAQDLGITIDFDRADPTLLTLPEEKELAKQLLEFPEVILRGGIHLEVHGISTYLHELAKQFQIYYSRAKQDSRYRVLDESHPAETGAKLALLKSVQTVLKNGLDLLGIAAPERMESESVLQTQ